MASAINLHMCACPLSFTGGSNLDAGCDWRFNHLRLIGFERIRGRLLRIGLSIDVCLLKEFSVDSRWISFIGGHVHAYAWTESSPSFRRGQLLSVTGVRRKAL